MLFYVPFFPVLHKETLHLSPLTLHTCHASKTQETLVGLYGLRGETQVPD